MRGGLSVTCVLLVFSSLLHADTPPPQAATVPFELTKSRHMVVMVKINGKGPYRLIFDTGAPATVINNKVARDSGVLGKDFKKPAFTVFGAMGQFAAKTLEIGDLKAENIPTLVMDHPLVAAMDKAHGPLDGILGFPFFARYQMTLDYQAKTMTLVPNGFEPVDVAKKLEATLLAGSKPGPRMLVPAGQWGMVIDKNAKDDAAGVAIKEVMPGSAGAAAGLRAGDRLLTLDDRWTDSVIDCYEAAGQVKPGTAATVVVERGGKKLQLTVKPRTGL